MSSIAVRLRMMAEGYASRITRAPYSGWRKDSAQIEITGREVINGED